MKTLILCISVVLMILFVPLSLYQTYLLYQHVHATETMWLLYIIQAPASIASALLAQAVKNLKD